MSNIVTPVQPITAPSQYLTNVDEASPTVTYIGKAPIGSLESSAKWYIIKVEVVGATTTIKYAGGESTFNKVWDDRLTYSYT